MINLFIKHNLVIESSEFHSMHPNSTYLPVLPHLPLTHALPLSENIKNNLTNPKQYKETNKPKEKNDAPPSFHPLQYLLIQPCVTGNQGVSRSRPVCPTSLTCKCSLQCVISVVQGLWFLVDPHHRILTRTSQR